MFFHEIGGSITEFYSFCDTHGEWLELLNKDKYLLSLESKWKQYINSYPHISYMVHILTQHMIITEKETIIIYCNFMKLPYTEEERNYINSEFIDELYMSHKYRLQVNIKNNEELVNRFKKFFKYLSLCCIIYNKDK